MTDSLIDLCLHWKSSIAIVKYSGGGIMMWLFHICHFKKVSENVIRIVFADLFWYKKKSLLRTDRVNLQHLCSGWHIPNTRVTCFCAPLVHPAEESTPWVFLPEVPNKIYHNKTSSVWFMYAELLKSELMRVKRCNYRKKILHVNSSSIVNVKTCKLVTLTNYFILTFKKIEVFVEIKVPLLLLTKFILGGC